jgi:hypothetical protein
MCDKIPFSVVPTGISVFFYYSTSVPRKADNNFTLPQICAYQTVSKVNVVFACCTFSEVLAAVSCHFDKEINSRPGTEMVLLQGACKK